MRGRNILTRKRLRKDQWAAYKHYYENAKQPDINDNNDNDSQWQQKVLRKM